jgi:hypothetical protein
VALVFIHLRKKLRALVTIKSAIEYYFLNTVGYGENLLAKNRRQVIRAGLMPTTVRRKDWSVAASLMSS